MAIDLDGQTNGRGIVTETSREKNDEEASVGLNSSKERVDGPEAERVERESKTKTSEERDRGISKGRSQIG